VRFQVIFSEISPVYIYEADHFPLAFDVEILALARRLGFRVKEAPVTWVNEGESKVKFKGMVNMLLEILRIRLNLWSGKYK